MHRLFDRCSKALSCCEVGWWAFLSTTVWLLPSSSLQYQWPVLHHFLNLWSYQKLSTLICSLASSGREQHAGVEYAPFGSLQWAKVGGGSDGWKTVTSFLAAVSVLWRKNGRPSAPGKMGGNLHMVATSFPSPHLFILEKQSQSINPSVLLSEQRTKGIWQPILWSSYSRFLEAGPVFGILTQVLSSDAIPFAWPWWFWLQFSDNQVCYEQRTEERRGIEGRKLSNTSIESNTALSKHWPLLEWIICNNPLWLPNIHWLCKLGLPKFELS